MTNVGCSRAVVTRCNEGGRRKCESSTIPQRLAIFETRQPDRQARIVGERRTHADHHGVMQRPQHLHAPVRRLARNLEARRPWRARGEAVRRLGQFERHHRPAVGDAQDMAEIGAPRSIGEHADFNFDACGRRRAWPCRQRADQDQPAPRPTRAIPAAMIASAHGGVRP